MDSGNEGINGIYDGSSDNAIPRGAALVPRMFGSSQSQRSVI
jgi:hypothetical protein